MRGTRTLVAALSAVAVAAAIPAIAAIETPGPGSGLTDSGRKLDPIGRMTTLGAFPTGGALTPDGRFYWAVDAGRGANWVRIIDVGSGAVRQALPLPGGYVGITFAPDGKHAYVSGQPAGSPTAAGAKGEAGDVVHRYSVDPRSGRATELDPISLPDARDGSAAKDELPPASSVNAWPEGLAVSGHGRYLVVALGQADQAAIIDLEKGGATLSDVGRYPYGVVIDPHRPRAYVTNERDGTVSVVSLPSGDVLGTIAVGGPRGNGYAHPEGLVADPKRDRLYVAVTERDLVAVVDTKRMALSRYVDVGRPEGLGTAPVALALSPDADTLYSADSGEDAVAAVALSRRPTAAAGKRRRVRLAPTVTKVRRYRSARARARRLRSRRLRLARTRAQRRAVERRHRRTLKRLRRRYLRGRLIRSCHGPTHRQRARFVRSVLKAVDRLAADRRRARRSHGRTRRRKLARAHARYTRAIRRARRRLRKPGCPPRGYLPNAPAFSVLGRLPTASYPTDVAVTPDGRKLVWLAAKGLGTGPNSGGDHDISKLLVGRAGVTGRPTDKGIAALTERANRAVVPTNHAAPPPGTPISGPGGGPSDKIKHVFYVIRENRTYDQILGSDPRGNGDPAFEMFDDNGVPGPTGGVTPNVHALTRKFSLMDNVYANSEESTVGHKISAGGNVNDYTQRYVNTARGRKGNPDIFPIGIPPNGFVFDQAVRQRVPFHVYGELGAMNQPFGNDGRPTYNGVLANTDPDYPTQVSGGCLPFSAPPPNNTRCTADSGQVLTAPGPATNGPPYAQSRIRVFQTDFQSQVAGGRVPAFNYLILFNDHTQGTDPTYPSPNAMVADNDLALGQLVELISNSSIWKDSAIFVMEDDSQSGIDHVDAHRMPALVISPWAKHGGVVISTRYDQYSFLRTAEMIVGLRPVHLEDALATPLYDAFISGNQQPDVNGTSYRAIQPQQSLTETNPANAADARLSRAMPFDQVDLVPQAISDRILWHSIFGEHSTPPPPGPNSSPVENARAAGALRVFRGGGNVRRYLRRTSDGDD